jgi:hypothetical protein
MNWFICAELELDDEEEAIVPELVFTRLFTVPIEPELAENCCSLLFLFPKLFVDAGFSELIVWETPELLVCDEDDPDADAVPELVVWELWSDETVEDATLEDTCCVLRTVFGLIG